MLGCVLKRPSSINTAASRTRNLSCCAATACNATKVVGSRIHSTDANVDRSTAAYREDSITAQDLGIRSNEGAQSTHIRHLLRAILRECTYLPDSQARTWIRTHTLSRFRTYDFKAWEHRHEAEDAGAWQTRFRAKKKEARQALALLQRANQGVRKCLLRVLLLTYGRTGKRRHELMMPLMPKKGGQEIAAIMELQARQDDSEAEHNEDLPVQHEAISTDEVKHAVLPTGKYTPDLTPQLKALLISQVQTQPPDLTRPRLRRISLEIPDLNSWHRPIPQKRIKNMRHRHYAHLLERMHSPLPTQEWLRLRDLATGKASVENARPRRSGALATFAQQSALEMVVAYGKVPTKVFANQEAHAITPRFMQRLYAQVFAQCPCIDWDKEKSEWIVSWRERGITS